MSEWKDIETEASEFASRHRCALTAAEVKGFARRCIANGVRDAAAELEQLQHPEAAKAMWEFADRIESGEAVV